MKRFHTRWIATPTGPLRVDIHNLGDSYLLFDIGDEHRLTRYGARQVLQEHGLDFPASYDTLDAICKEVTR